MLLVIARGFIPCIGFGTWQAKSGKEAADTVTTALHLGYRQQLMEMNIVSELLLHAVVLNEKTYLLRVNLIILIMGTKKIWQLLIKR